MSYRGYLFLVEELKKVEVDVNIRLWYELYIKYNDIVDKLEVVKLNIVYKLKVWSYCFVEEYLRNFWSNEEIFGFYYWVFNEIIFKFVIDLFFY